MATISDDEKLTTAGHVLGKELLATLLGTIDKAKSQLDAAGHTSKAKSEKADDDEEETNEDDDEQDAEDTEGDEDSKLDAAFTKKMAPYTKKMREEMKALFEASHEAAHGRTTKELARLIGDNNKVLVTAFATAMAGLQQRAEKAARDTTLAELKAIAAELSGTTDKSKVKSKKAPEVEVEETDKEVTAMPFDDFLTFVNKGAAEVKV